MEELTELANKGTSVVSFSIDGMPGQPSKLYEVKPGETCMVQTGYAERLMKAHGLCLAKDACEALPVQTFPETSEEALELCFPADTDGHANVRQDDVKRELSAPEKSAPSKKSKSKT